MLRHCSCWEHLAAAETCTAQLLQAGHGLERALSLGTRQSPPVGALPNNLEARGKKECICFDLSALIICKHLLIGCVRLRSLSSSGLISPVRYISSTIKIPITHPCQHRLNLTLILSASLPSEAVKLSAPHLTRARPPSFLLSPEGGKYLGVTGWMATGKSADFNPSTDLSHERREEFPPAAAGMFPVSLRFTSPCSRFPSFSRTSACWHSANFSLGVPQLLTHVTSKHLQRQQGAGSSEGTVIKGVMSGLFKGDVPKGQLKGQIFSKPVV